jgi:hypothetical protein
MSIDVGKILELTNDDSSFIESYKKLRELLRDNGFTEETISRISSAPLDVWNLHTQLLSDMNVLKGKLKKFWGVSEEDVKTYLVDKMNEINKLIPLNDGDIK